MTIDDWNETIESEIDDMYAEGISSFKMYMTYPAMMIGDEAMYRALKKLEGEGRHLRRTLRECRCHRRADRREEGRGRERRVLPSGDAA